jgi:S1-C subfamily serine protease
MFICRCFAGAMLIAGATCSADQTAYRTALANAVRSAANRVLPAVVTVEIVGSGGPAAGEVERDAPTSGVIVDSSGYIIASSIVVSQPAASILVVLSDGSRRTAKVVARDEHRDLVLLQIPTDQPLPAIELTGNPDLPIGSTTIAVGRYGSDATPLISRGVLSARDRLDGIALQTDARVSPAFYGGPLLDLYGNVLGILVPAVGEGGAADATGWYDSGIAFAIPAEVIAGKLARLKSGEDIKQGLIGIVAKTRDPIESGTEIAAVRTRSPAESAQIKAGDEVLSVNGQSVRRHQEIRQALGRFDAGETIAIKLRRGDRELDVEVELAASIPPLQPQQLGVIVSEVKRDEKSMVVVDAVLPDSPAATELRIGDVIQQVDEAEISATDSLRRQLISAEPDTPLAITYQRQEASTTVEITPRTIAGPIQASLPENWQSTAEQKPWSVSPLKLPEAANAAAYVGPTAEEVAAADPNRAALGLLVLLIAPGDGTPEVILQRWPKFASQAGVVILAIAPEDAQRWQPKELDAVANFAAAVLKKFPIHPLSVAVATSGALQGGKTSAADSMALAVAISQSRTFFGVAVSDQTRPPAIRLRENEPSSSLQVLLPIGAADDLPSWASGLERVGYPIIRGAELNETQLLHWVRLLQSI